MTERFLDRQGYQPPAAQITVREDAPSVLRDAIPLIAKATGMKPSAMRQVICEVLLVKPDPGNWSDYPSIWDDVTWLMENASWYEVQPCQCFAPMLIYIASHPCPNMPSTSATKQSD